MSKTINPLVSDRDVDFLLYEMLDTSALCAFPDFADHSPETFDLYVRSARRLAREILFPAYKPMDEEPARFDGEGLKTHPLMREIWPHLVSLGMLRATRPAAVGGHALPFSVAVLAG